MALDENQVCDAIVSSRQESSLKSECKDQDSMIYINSENLSASESL